MDREGVGDSSSCCCCSRFWSGVAAVAGVTVLEAAPAVDEAMVLAAVHALA